ncbi:DUF262 domain-containing protein [Mariniplasma anaerobium]|uniref:DUF262 domain-containing protein n=1 Tax=Mariniplasma anaerobium TaxID=2735436 RepID=A0A7U9TIF3_9MOLU|nr:DUF262 domain-containing protein [Mariniplasma anaerobium]BCR36679.1 hypothetical protein MPAN_015720 [Mariniplasma anaerobium]
MQASKTYMMSLIGAHFQQYKVPVYQRTYDWQAKHCNQLIEDIFAIMGKEKEHFTGTIVYLNETDLISRKISLLIDGQQRVTTMIIILKALEMMANEKGFAQLKQQINDKYLFTDTNELKQINKLIPTEEDQKEFELLMLGKIEDLNSSLGFYKNYSIIKSKLSNRISSQEDMLRFFQALHKLTIIELSLNKGVDDPQEIFESINSTGLELSKADLIRNFLLMSVKQQDYLYKNYWKPLYNLLGGENLEDFMFNFLLYKLQRKVNNSEIYNLFTELFRENNYSRESILIELNDIAIIYHALTSKSDRYSEQIKELLSQYRYIEQTTMYPFFIQVFKDFDNHIINEDEVVKVLQFFLNYHIKRLVCGSSSNSLRGLYLNLYNRIFKIEQNKQRYYDSIAYYMKELKTKDEVPNENQFLKNLKSTELYKQRKLVKFLLASVENTTKEILLTDNLTVEHIMPQTLENSWIKMLGDNYNVIHDTYLHTLGNLSLTGYNSNMGNKSFDDKKVVLKEHSKANRLNSDVLDKNQWSKNEIEERAIRLSSIINSLFKAPKHNSKDIRFENVIEHTLEDEYEDYKGQPLYSFKFINMDHEYKQDTYKNMLINIIDILDSMDSKIMDDIAKDLFNPWKDGTLDKIANNTNNAGNRTLHKFREDLYLVGGFSSGGVIYSIKKLMEYYDIPIQQFIFYTRVKEILEDIEI